MSVEPHITEFTTISLSPDAPLASDRRIGKRYMTVLQAAKLVTEDGQELCLVRNISTGGMMAEIFVPLSPGEAVGIEFKAGSVVGGRVRWVEDGRAGIEFFDKIDVHQVLAPSGAKGRMMPRGVRLNIDSMATVDIGDDISVDLPIFDISQGGVKVAAHRKLEAGLEVIVAIDGLPARASRVCWVDDNYAGISFNQLMPLDEVAFWAAQQRPRQLLEDMIGPMRQPEVKH